MDIGDLPLDKEEIYQKNMPHFKCLKIHAESSNTYSNDNNEFLLEIPDLEFYPASSREKKIPNKNSCTTIEAYSSNDFGLYTKENLSSYKRNSHEKLFLDPNTLDKMSIGCSPRYHDFQLDYNLGTQNYYYPASDKFDIDSSKELNFASLNDDYQTVTSPDSQQKRKLSQEGEKYLMSKERKKSMKDDELAESTFNSWSQFFEDFRVDKNKEIMAVSPTSPDLTASTFHTNHCYFESSAANRLSTSLNLASQGVSNPLLPSVLDFHNPTSNEKFTPTQKCLSYFTEKPDKKLAQIKTPLFSQFSNQTKIGNFVFSQNGTSHSSSVLNKRQVNLNKILPDKVVTGAIGNSHHKRKTISIGLAQPLMRNSQEAGL